MQPKHTGNAQNTGLAPGTRDNGAMLIGHANMPCNKVTQTHAYGMSTNDGSSSVLEDTSVYAV